MPKYEHKFYPIDTDRSNIEKRKSTEPLVDSGCLVEWPDAVWPRQPASKRRRNCNDIRRHGQSAAEIAVLLAPLSVLALPPQKMELLTPTTSTPQIGDKEALSSIVSSSVLLKLEHTIRHTYSQDSIFALWLY